LFFTLNKQGRTWSWDWCAWKYTRFFLFFFICSRTQGQGQIRTQGCKDIRTVRLPPIQLPTQWAGLT